MLKDLRSEAKNQGCTQIKVLEKSFAYFMALKSDSRAAVLSNHGNGK